MSEHLDEAMKWLREVSQMPTVDGEVLRLHWAMWEMCHHLEAQSPAAAERASETSSSAVIETPAETKPTSTILYRSSFRANQDGTLPLKVQQGIAASCSSQVHPGAWLEVAITAIPTSKDVTPPSGSDSPSTPEQASSVSGAPGTDALRDSSSIAGREPIPMLLICPGCHGIHVDEGEWATRPHRTHQCQFCRHEWRPANVATVGVADSSPHQSATSPAGSALTSHPES